MKLRLTTLGLLFAIAACSGGSGTSMQTTPSQPQPVQGIRANVNYFGFGFTEGNKQVTQPHSAAAIQVVIGLGVICDGLLVLNGVTNSIACDAVVFIPNSQLFTSLPGFSYSSPALANGQNYSLDLYQGVATACTPTGCVLSGPFTLIASNIGQAGGFTASANTVSCNSVATCGTNGFPFLAEPVLGPPLNVGYLVNLRPS